MQPSCDNNPHTKEQTVVWIYMQALSSKANIHETDPGLDLIQRDINQWNTNAPFFLHSAQLGIKKDFVKGLHVRI
jgi:hypothetical protein